MLNRTLLILNKYVKEFLKLNSNIKIIENRNFYIIYFLDKDFYFGNLNKIDDIFNFLKQKYLTKLNKNVLYGYIYDYYIDYQDFEDDIKNGLCKDLTYIFFKHREKLYYEVNDISSIFYLENDSFSMNKDINNSEYYIETKSNNVHIEFDKKDYILSNIRDLNGRVTAA
ncbi:hypothetical protein [Brachyspira intermedia]|uniref:hypothetical protein n=1 Tax=Brachyspira intermedia TaxID=84377 RepID=UPI0026125D9E|nr:hypothetical protein [uncultured Brachyspira sp.]